MPSNTQLMAKLMGRFRNSMNGVVTESMESKGINYGLNYGVAIHTIRNIASDFAPNDSLAKLLFRQPVRELKIAATYIAEPVLLNIDELDFWSTDICTVEIAEHVGRMFGDSDMAWTVASAWADRRDPLLLYVAILSCARKISQKPQSLEDFDIIARCVGAAALMPESFNWRASVSLIERMGRLRVDMHSQLGELTERLRIIPNLGATYIIAESEALMDL